MQQKTRYSSSDRFNIPYSNVAPPLDFSYQDIKHLDELPEKKRIIDNINNKSKQEKAQNDKEKKQLKTKNLNEKPTKQFPSQPTNDSKDKITKNHDSNTKITSVRLCYNQLESIEGIHNYFSQIFDNALQINWLDISHNQLSTIHPDLLLFQDIQVLYLHGNRFSDINEVTKLQEFKKLTKLTLHGFLIQYFFIVLGNIELEKIKNYRIRILYLLPNLASLDFVRYTPQDYDQAKVYSEAFERKKKNQKFKGHDEKEK